MFIVSPFIPFPNISWWAMAGEGQKVIFDAAEYFEKMSYRNRYYITGSNGLITLSVPLEQGRDQRAVMGNIRISNQHRWQVQHWRTIVSVYKRAPYFDHYEQALQELYLRPFESLIEFNMASVRWLKQETAIAFEEEVADEFIKEYTDASGDLRRNFKPGIEKQALNAHPYYQLFSERNGFLPDLSLLDLLFTEGPHTMQWIKANRQMILNWRNPDKKL